MIRVLAAFFTALVMVLITTMSCGILIKQRNELQNHSQLHQRIGELDAKIEYSIRWGKPIPHGA